MGSPAAHGRKEDGGGGGRCGRAGVGGWALARVSERPAEAALADGEALVASLRRPGRSVPVRERLSGEPLRRLRVLFCYVTMCA